MNYRHIFHAGNRCDVVKHSVLTLILGHLRQKERGFAVLDTHAGIGLYDLDDVRAQKTNEARDGIKALLAAPALPQLSSYYAILRKLNPNWDHQGDDQGLNHFRVYPGSPLVSFHMLRAQDRIAACELHPDDAEILRLNSPADARLQIHRRDGYEALTAFLPPPEKRGLVLIDPPFEKPDEFDTLVTQLISAVKRWPSGNYMVWYPIKDRPTLWSFHEQLATSGIANILCAEFIYEPETRSDRLNGCGLIFVNPPWKLDEELSALFPALHVAMNTAYHQSLIRWLAPQT